MGDNLIDLGHDQSNRSVLKQLATIIELRCVECASLYPGISDQPRYRCDCGGVLDVEAKIHFPLEQDHKLLEGFETLTTSERDVKVYSVAQWRQLFAERASQSTAWPVKVDKQLPNTSGVWR